MQFTCLQKVKKKIYCKCTVFNGCISLYFTHPVLYDEDVSVEKYLLLHCVHHVDLHFYLSLFKF